jgi:hypothetical protein
MDRFLNKRTSFECCDEADAKRHKRQENHLSDDHDHQPDDVESRIVQYILSRASWGVRNSISSKGSCRKILVIGKPYYWLNECVDMDKVPECFKEFAAKHGVDDCNSILCNVYESKESRIAKHCDNTSLLEPKKGEVVSISLAINYSDRSQELAKMYFSDKTNISLKHCTVVRFDAFSDARANRTHCIPSTYAPRISLTYRHLK